MFLNTPVKTLLLL